MGTANFLYNHRLDVITGTSFHNFDLEAHNEGLDEDCRLDAGDEYAIGEVLNLNCEDAVNDIKFRAEENYRVWRKHRQDGFRILSTAGEAEDRGEYRTRCFGGTRIATISAETLFWGINIFMEMDVILRCGYYDGYNIDQSFRIFTDYSNYRILDEYDVSSFQEAVDYVIEELEDADIATKRQLYPHQQGISRRLCALEQVLWQRYEELIAPWCEEYRVSARFGNGETWYSKCAA